MSRPNENLLARLFSLKVLLGTDAPEVRGWAPAVQQAAQKTVNDAINAVKAKGLTHVEECAHDPSARDVCVGLYIEKCDDVIGLCEALRAVLALAGESAEVRKIVEEAIAEHGGVGEC